jgi:hypothetical protein
VDCSLYAFNVCGEKPSILLSASYISHSLDNNNLISPINYLFTGIIDRIDEIETAVLIKLKGQVSIPVDRYFSTLKKIGLLSKI